MSTHSVTPLVLTTLPCANAATASQLRWCSDAVQPASSHETATAAMARWDTPLPIASGSSSPGDVLAKLQAAARLDLHAFLTFEIARDAEHPNINGDGVRYSGIRFRAG